MRGTLLWLRHTGFISLAAVGAVLLGLVNIPLSHDITQGESISTRGLWNAAIIALTVGLALRPESDIEIAVPRSLFLRRITLIGGVLTFSLLTGVIFLLDQPFEGGLLAQWRDTLALSGLTMISGCLLGRGLVWLLPLVAAVGSLVMHYPTYPSTLETGIFFLKADGGLRTSDGTLDISWLVAIALLLGGAVLYLLDIRLIGRGGFRGIRLSASDEAVSFVLMLIATALVTMSSHAEWDGSARIVIAQAMPSAGFILVPIAAAAGCFLGQRRHRCGFVPWEKTAPGGHIRAFLSTAGRALLAILGGYATAATLLALSALPLLDAGAALTEWLISCGLIALGAMAGCGVGWLVRYWPATPLMALACAIGMAAVPASQPPFSYADPTTRSADLYCRGTAPLVCGFPDNFGYIDALSTLAEREYRKSGIADVLPASIMLIDDGAEQPRMGQAYIGRSQLAVSRHGDMIPEGKLWELLFAENAGRCSDERLLGFVNLRRGNYPATAEERASADILFNCLRR